MKTVTEKQLRQVTVLVRYFIKSTKNVVLYVENDKGVRYYVSLRRDGNHSCSCPAKKGTCYHIKVCRSAENARIATRKAAKVAQQEDKLPTQEVVSLNDKRRERDMLDAPLTRNSGFSLLKVS